MNNYEKIQSMSVDEMAEWLVNYYCALCPRITWNSKELKKQWLLAEVEE